MSGKNSRKRRMMLKKEEMGKHRKQAYLELEFMIYGAEDLLPFDLIERKLTEFGFSERDIYDRRYQARAYMLTCRSTCRTCVKGMIADYFTSLVLERPPMISISAAEICFLSIDKFCVGLTRDLLIHGYFELANPTPLVDIKQAKIFLKNHYMYVLRGYPRSEKVLTRIVISTLKQLKHSKGRMDNGSKSARGFKRILNMTLLLYAVYLKGINSRYIYNYVMCVLCYFKTIPDPHVSKQEFQEFLTHLDIAEPEDIRTMVDDYALLFKFESEMSFMPRSLLDLCRISIRKNLMKGKDRTLKNMVCRLFIPLELKLFLVGYDA